MDLETKQRLITKLGTAVRIRGRLKGVVISTVDYRTYLVSTGDHERNWAEIVHIEDLEVWKDKQ